MEKHNNLYYYFLELQNLRHEIESNTETLNKYERRKEMAKHSQLNSEGFVNRLTEDEDNIIERLQLAKERKKIFDAFTSDDWENSAIILKEYGLHIITWCIIEFEYKPYMITMDKPYMITMDNNKGYLYVFHNPEDAVGAKLRWA